MLERLQKLLRAFSPEAPARPRLVFDESDHRVAAAGLLVHAMKADGVRSPAEQDRLELILRERFSLDEGETADLILAADARDREAVDFNGFASIVKRAYNDQGRRRILEMMWEIAFADGSLHEFEDNLVWRVADIVGVPEADRETIRRTVAKAHGVTLPEIDA
jgi:uncharacterized tellurite resistance protein B-like protein